MTAPGCVAYIKGPWFAITGANWPIVCCGNAAVDAPVAMNAGCELADEYDSLDAPF